MSLYHSNGCYLQIVSANFDGHDVPVALFRDDHQKADLAYITLTSLVGPSGVSFNTLKAHAKKLDLTMVTDEAFVDICARHDVKFLKSYNQLYLNIREVFDVLKSCAKASTADAIEASKKDVNKHHAKFDHAIAECRHVITKQVEEDEVEEGEECDNDVDLRCSICKSADSAELYLCASCCQEFTLQPRPHNLRRTAQKTENQKKGEKNKIYSFSFANRASIKTPKSSSNTSL